MANGSTNDEARSDLNSTTESLGSQSTDQGGGLLDGAAALGDDSSDDGAGIGPICYRAVGGTFHRVLSRERYLP